MKKVLIIWITLLIFGSAKSQETEYIQKGNRVLKVKVISDIKFKDIHPSVFSEEEIKRMEKGETVNIISEKKVNLVKLLPLVEVEGYQIISSYTIEKGMVEKIKEDQEFSYLKKSWLISILWIYFPFIFIFATALYGYRNNKRSVFIVFSILTTIAVIAAIIVGGLINPIWALIFGFFIGGIAGVGEGEGFGGFAGAFAGALSGITSSMVEGFPLILWQYVLIYVCMCGISLSYQEMIIFLKKRRLSKKLADIKKAADEKITSN